MPNNIYFLYISEYQILAFFCVLKIKRKYDLNINSIDFTKMKTYYLRLKKYISNKYYLFYFRISIWRYKEYLFELLYLLFVFVR